MAARVGGDVAYPEGVQPMASLQERERQLPRRLLLPRAGSTTFTARHRSTGRGRGGSPAASSRLLMLHRAEGRSASPTASTSSTFVLHGGQASRSDARAAGPPAGRRFGHAQRPLPRRPTATGRWRRTRLATARMHLGHFVPDARRGVRRSGDLTLADLQRHVNERAKKKYRGRPLSPVTLRKEVATLPGRLELGRADGPGRGPFPAKGLRLPQGRREAAVHDAGARSSGASPPAG